MNITRTTWFLILLCLHLLVPATVYGANKALLIGTTAYEQEQNNLPGIDLDIAEMNRIARKLGFEPSNIRTLTDKEVTLENIQNQFDGFLQEEVLPGDTVLIYYSGHGVQVPDKNGDESDGEDEAISLYNLAGVSDLNNGGQIIWDGVLIDDQLSDLLGKLVSENVIVIVDACHSGTVTRSYTGTSNGSTKAYGGEQFSIKSLGPQRNVTRSLSLNSGSVIDEDNSGVITLSAAQDNQQALSSSRGSLFTLALAESLEAQRSNASPKSLIASVEELLDKRLDDDLVYQPNLTGDSSLFAKPIVLTDASDRNEVNQADILKMTSDINALKIGDLQPSYSENDLISLSVDVPADGYLNILAVDSNDDMVLLFPNGVDTNNQVQRGAQTLPGSRGFTWSVQPPWGNTMIAVLYSEAPIDLFEMSLQRDESGKAHSDYVLPSLDGLMAFESASGTKAAGIEFLKTCQTRAGCK